MKAFISHSSKDKHLVRQIAEELGDMRCEYDEYSFEFELNSIAIRKALDRSNLFVLILSQHSVRSDFVKEEIRGALERRGSGKISNIMIFSIDETSYSELPAWLREINVASRIKNAKQISRKIDARLTEMSLDDGRIPDFYFGRSAEEQNLRVALAKPKKDSPLAVHVVGHHGVGRRTFLRKSLAAAAPRHYESYIELPVEEYDSVNEIYRKLYDVVEIVNPLRASEDFENFSYLSQVEKCEKISEYISKLADEGTLPIFFDEGGVLQDNGDYQPYFPEIFSKLQNFSRPVAGFIQYRMMKFNYKKNHQRSIHIRLNQLDDETVFELMCLKLKELDIDFQIDEVKIAQKFTDGHPFNINLVVAYIAEEGMSILLSDPSEVLESKAERGQSFIRRIDFSDIESDIVAILHEYVSADIDFIFAALDKGGVDVTEALRRLEDFCCIERREQLFVLSPLIRDAIRRDKRFSRDDKWAGVIGARVLDTIKEVEDFENVTLSFIDGAIYQMLKTGQMISHLNSIILPTHLLRLGRQYYDRGKWQSAVDFMHRALEREYDLTMDAKVEANRILGLALTRIDSNSSGIGEVVKTLRRYGTATARRVAFFVEGFRARRNGQYPAAEEKFLAAAALGSQNYHINRELSSVLCHQGRYSEAEPYARAAYSRTPENPYIVDILIEALEGKVLEGYSQNRAEVARLYEELKVLCDSGGYQFYDVRIARIQKSSKKIQSLVIQENDFDDGDLMLILRRGQLRAKDGDLRGARADMKILRDGAEKTKEYGIYALELECQCYIAESRFKEAKDVVDRSSWIGPAIQTRLYRELARAVGYSPNAAPLDIRDWAKSY
jgi:hypothetical protein